MTLRARAGAQEEAVEFYDCGESRDAWLEHGDGHSGRGWYVWCSEYPADGAWFLGPALLSTGLVLRAPQSWLPGPSQRARR